MNFPPTKSTWLKHQPKPCILKISKIRSLNCRISLADYFKWCSFLPRNKIENFYFDFVPYHQRWSCISKFNTNPKVLITVGLSITIFTTRTLLRISTSTAALRAPNTPSSIGHIITFCSPLYTDWNLALRYCKSFAGRAAEKMDLEAPGEVASLFRSSIVLATASQSIPNLFICRDNRTSELCRQEETSETVPDRIPEVQSCFVLNAETYISSRREMG